MGGWYNFGNTLLLHSKVQGSSPWLSTKLGVILRFFASDHEELFNLVEEYSRFLNYFVWYDMVKEIKIQYGELESFLEQRSELQPYQEPLDFKVAREDYLQAIEDKMLIAEMSDILATGE